MTTQNNGPTDSPLGPKTLEAIETWSKVADDIVQMDREDMPSISPGAFRVHFLEPLIDQRQQTLIDNWKKVAGHVGRMIRVLGADGELLATLPPLMGRIDTQMEMQESKGLHAILDDAAKHAALSPRAGQLVMEEGFHNRKFQSSTMLQSMLVWNNLAESLELPVPFKALDAAVKQTRAERSPDVGPGPASSAGYADQDELA